ncbi:MAG: hypothetical protein HUU20_14605 [Pirellulales bacterium]|nr:hypothetical protein [Pirellulales bacterium]
MPVDRPHGPLGLEQLVAAVSQLNPAVGTIGPSVRRPITLSQQTWHKLDQLAESGMRRTSQHVTASQVAAAIVEQYVAALPARSETEQ